MKNSKQSLGILLVKNFLITLTVYLVLATINVSPFAVTAHAAVHGTTGNQVANLTLSTEIFALLQDVTPPDVPTVKMIIPKDTAIKGTAEKLSTVSITFPGGLTTTTAAVGETGTWTIATTSQQQAALSAGSTVTVVAIDESGNRSQPEAVSISTNLALNRPTTANAYNDQQQGPNRAVNGIVSDKWCSVTPINGTQQHWLLIDLGSTRKVSRWRVWHAEAGTSGDTGRYNTTDFKLQGSTDGAVFFDMDSVTGNAIKMTDRTFTENMIRYARLYITDPCIADAYARIQEIELYGDINSTNDTIAPMLPTLYAVYNYSTTISGIAETGASIIVQNINGNTVGVGSQGLRMKSYLVSGLNMKQISTSITYFAKLDPYSFHPSKP